MTSIGLEKAVERVGGGGEGTRPRPVVEAVVRGAFAERAEFREFAEAPRLSGGQADFLFGSPEEEHDPVKVFGELRWGGQFVFCSTEAREVEAVAAHFGEHGFEVETR